MSSTMPREREVLAEEVWAELLRIGWALPRHLPSSTTLRVGSICSGWCSEIWALRSLARAHTLTFGCDSNNACARLCHDNFQHEQWFMDCTSDEFLLKSPPVDLLVSGFPCQPYSIEGSSQGINSVDGLVLLYVLHYIRTRLPRSVLLENVMGLERDHPETLVFIVEALKAIQKGGRPYYHVSWQVLNARTHGGLPQNRPRLFIAATHGSAMQWPGEVPMRPITDFIPGDPTRRGTDYPGPLPRTMTTRRNLIKLLTRLEKEGKDPLGAHYICDLASMTPRAVLGWSPCLTRARCTTGGHWLAWRQRWMHLREICLLQGLDSELLRTDRVSQRELAMMAGNAIPIPLLARVLQGVLAASY
ncbi:bsp6IM [Symbiodinium sp. CCMP2456]|nr:bsp6IM [Symbiodinium sp. CCMP2456]